MHPAQQCVEPERQQPTKATQYFYAAWRHRKSEFTSERTWNAARGGEKKERGEECVFPPTLPQQEDWELHRQVFVLLVCKCVCVCVCVEERFSACEWNPVQEIQIGIVFLALLWKWSNKLNNVCIYIQMYKEDFD